MARLVKARISELALSHNLAECRRHANGAKIMAVVKADAYGHGLERVATALQSADAFGVAALEDAERLRKIGLNHRIVLLSGIDESADLVALRRLQVETVIHHESQLAILEADAAEGAASRSAPIRTWLKIDTGMHRLGFRPEEVSEAYARLRALPFVDDSIALMTHFASSDDFGGTQTAVQISNFLAATERLPGPRCMANSAAVLGWPLSTCDWVRAGGALYGMSVIEGRTGADFGLLPAMQLETKLIAVRSFDAGDPIGYSASWRCPEKMSVGVAAIGYGDGYPRRIRPNAVVLINGVRVPIIGRVSMDLITLDLRCAPDAKVGDQVVCWGPDLPVEEVAAHAGTIGYELTSSLTARVMRV